MRFSDDFGTYWECSQECPEENKKLVDDVGYYCTDDSFCDVGKTWTKKDDNGTDYWQCDYFSSAPAENSDSSDDSPAEDSGPSDGSSAQEVKDPNGHSINEC